MKLHYLIFYRGPGYPDWHDISSINFLSWKDKTVKKFSVNGSMEKSYFSRKVAEEVRRGLVEYERVRIQEMIDHYHNQMRQGVTYINFPLDGYTECLKNIDSFFILSEEEWHY